MAENVKVLSFSDIGLQGESQSFLFVAYKNVSWRIIALVEPKENIPTNKNQTTFFDKCSRKIETDLAQVRSDLVKVLDNRQTLLMQSDLLETFCHMLEGDSHHNLARITTEEEERKAAINSSHQAYKLAMDSAEQSLVPTHPIRLGLALNYSVFVDEMLNSRDQACHVAKSSFDNAISGSSETIEAELEALGEESRKDAVLILGLLRDNLTAWDS
ncbi:14-3-3 domain-containing protein [Aspergillus lucknowensis]|uniref:14-3-3 domain-containing protein n=1 Tax=Aspergillus lucknowensis TaxID=176173 RepID=A0ABR4LQ47_9EURO